MNIWVVMVAAGTALLLTVKLAVAAGAPVPPGSVGVIRTRTVE